MAVKNSSDEQESCDLKKLNQKTWAGLDLSLEQIVWTKSLLTMYLKSTESKSYAHGWRTEKQLAFIF